MKNDIPTGTYITDAWFDFGIIKNPSIEDSIIELIAHLSKKDALELLLRVEKEVLAEFRRD